MFRQKCLMLGAGHKNPTRRLLAPTSVSEEETKWVTVDNNLSAKPDVLFDLEGIDKGMDLPFLSEAFDEIHAYEVLEHFGRQGDYRGFFSAFRAFWRVLKDGGLLMGTSPSTGSPWLWGDPGHTRVISPSALSFLRRNHHDQLGQTTSSDYRSLIAPCWWSLDHSNDDGMTHVFALRKTS